MTTVESAPRTPTISKRTGRRIGYSVAILVNLLIYGFINVWPGWESFDFITPQAADVVPWVNLSIGVSILVNVIYLVSDRVRVKALGEIVTSTVSLVVSAVVLDVFPFDFSGYAFPWELLTRFILIVAIIGSAISVLVNLWRFVRGPRAGSGR
jgi:hypothetical protein